MIEELLLCRGQERREQAVVGRQARSAGREIDQWRHRQDERQEAEPRRGE